MILKRKECVIINCLIIIQVNMMKKEEVTEKLEKIVEKSLSELFEKNTEEFYYCSLITDGEGHCPIISAWSYEALERVTGSIESEELKEEYKWSYADSPYLDYGSEYFEDLKNDWEEHLKLELDDDEFDEEVEIRINIMEEVMKRLDEKGMFGKGKKRLKIIINAEFMPPEYSNTERAIRLNPREAIEEWLEEVAEEE